ncbi:C2 domain protein [Trichinella nativa]|uniref:C2 domain protein n=1 Tax=Trichinella nativa TaxID=6335 RepID=A0A1Y3ETH0_9BILA|nr:C2 domain protein [Trichinella nativa]
MEDENFVTPLLSKLKYLSQLLNSLNSLEISQLDELDMRQQSNDDNYLHDASYPHEHNKHVSFDDGKDEFELLNTQQAEKNISMANTTDARLVDETLQLLNQATFIRVFIDELMWRKIPDFFMDDFRRRSHCNGSFAVRYTVPLFEKNSDRAYDKIITARSREILPSVVGFNHRHVSLLIVSPALLQHWAESYLSFCIYYKSSRKQESLIAKCSFPLCKLLVLPFAVEASLPLEMHCFGSASGILKVTVLIGSRHASFTERVEPLRNPTTMKLKSMSFLDTLTTTKPAVAGVGVGALNRQLKAAERSRGRKSGTAIDGSSFSPFVERHIVGRRDLTLPLDVPNEESLLSDQYDEIRFDRSHLQPLQSPLSDAGVEAVQSGHSVSTECVECHVDNLLKRRAFANIPISAKSRSVGVQTETVFDLTYDQHYSRTGSKFNQKIQANAQRSKWAAWKSPIQGRQCPMFLRLIVHQARYLPAVSSNGDEGQHMQPPSAFVSYRIDNRMIKSEVAPASFHPRWDWKTKLKLMPEQRTIVFHIWHKSSSDEQSGLLLGAVSVDVAQVVMSSSIRSTWWFDIIDLRAGSPGQLQLTIEALEPASEKNEESLCESLMKEVTSTSMDTPAASRSVLAETLK